MQTLLLLLLIALAVLPDTTHGSKGILIVGGLKESGECCQGSVELWSPNFQCKFPGTAAPAAPGPASHGGMVDGTVDLVGDRVVACGGKYDNINGQLVHHLKSNTTTQHNKTFCHQLWLKSPPGMHWPGMWESGAWMTIHARSQHTSVVTCSSFQGCNSSLPLKDLLLLGGEYSPDTSEVIQLAEGEERELMLFTNCNAKKELKSCSVNLTKTKEGESKETFPFVQGTGGPRQGHCSIQVDKRRVVLTGGSVQGESQSSATELNVWRGKAVTMSLPDLNSPREGHACGIYLKNGIKMLIVTGGVFKKQGSERLLYSTEILKGSRDGFPQRGGGAWRPSKRVVSLPPSFRGISARGATLDNTFYLIGGLNSNKTARRDILSWHPDWEEWVDAGELMFGRGGHAVTTVPLDLAKQHCAQAEVGFAVAGFVSTTSSASSLSWLLHLANLLAIAFEVIF